MALEAKLDAKIPEFAIVNTMEMALYQAEKFGDDEARIGAFLRSVCESGRAESRWRVAVRCLDHGFVSRSLCHWA